MPGLVNTHMHWQDERGGIPQPIQYERNLYLAVGVTTTREVGGDFDKSKRWQAESAAEHDHRAAHAGLLGRASKGNGTRRGDSRQRPRGQGARRRRPEDLRHGSRPARGVMDEAHSAGAADDHAHRAWRKTRRRTSSSSASTSIEHFYGIADAALDGVQDFPPDMNYTTRCTASRRAGELYAQANPARSCRQVLDLMVAKKRRLEPDAVDLRGQPRPDHARRTCPGSGLPAPGAARSSSKPNLDNHGSYFIGWTNTQEVRWKQQYRIWMDALQRVRRQGRPRSRPATMPGSSTRCTASAWSASSNCTRRRGSIRSR